MNTIHTLFSSSNILVRPGLSEKKAVLQAMIRQLEKSGTVTDPDQLLADVMEREKLAPTALGHGCAAPHAYSDAITKTEITAAVLDKGIDFGASDGEPATLIFLMAGPKSDIRLHLSMLSRLARLLHNQKMRNALKQVQNSGDFMELMSQWEC
ncbi:MAG: hypothetical protein CSA76_00175 [Spirochaetales bacterium]|nr:MAG: hypothetical protein CSA76_00175 [Spirochaetales bacterium]